MYAYQWWVSGSFLFPTHHCHCRGQQTRGGSVAVWFFKQGIIFWKLEIFKSPRFEWNADDHHDVVRYVTMINHALCVSMRNDDLSASSHKESVGWWTIDKLRIEIFSLSFQKQAISFWSQPQPIFECTRARRRIVPQYREEMNHCDFSHQQSGNSRPSLLLPRLIVFDLDDCLWSPEMHELDSKPCIPIQGVLNDFDDHNHHDSSNATPALLRGVVGLQESRGGDTVRLFPGARQVLYELATQPQYQGIRLACASSSLEPSYSYACLQAIEILPDLSMRQILSHVQIGRDPPLSSDKRSHFRLLHQESGIPHEEMLFFDDCNWGDHCTTVSLEFGVTSLATPHGLQYQEFQQGLAQYRRNALSRRQQEWVASQQETRTRTLNAAVP
jgi:magnesium-dependent phosphatase 1